MQSKPPSPGTPIRQNHPLAQGLARAWNFNGRRGRDSSGWAFRDSCANDTATYSRNNADTVWTDGPSGPAFKVGADGGSATFSGTSTLSAYDIAASSVSVVARLTSTGANPNLESVFGGNGHYVFTSRLLSTDTDAFSLVYSSGTSAGWNFVADGSGQLVGANYNTTPTAGLYDTLAGTYRRDTSIATYGGTWSIYTAGQFRGANNVSAAGSFAGTFTDRIPAFKAPGAFVADKIFDFVYVYRRCLLPWEVAWLADRPFDMYIPRRAWSIGASVAAGGASFRRTLYRRTGSRGVMV